MKMRGFTLIEVLLALAVIAIALSALLKTTAQDVSYTQRIKDKNISHWVAMQGIAKLQLGLITATPNQESTFITQMLNTSWYWRVKQENTGVPFMRKLTVTVSKQATGPFMDPLIAFQYSPPEKNP